LGVSVLPWDSAAAKAYADLCSASWKRGRPLATMDMLVAAHAFASGLTLVTSDRSFRCLRPASASPTGPNPYDLRQLFHCFYRATHHCKGTSDAAESGHMFKKATQYLVFGAGSLLECCGDGKSLLRFPP